MVQFRSDRELKGDCSINTHIVSSNTFWDDKNDDYGKGWDSRYLFESAMISLVLKERKNTVKSVLELGPGPGRLSALLHKELGDVTYHLVDCLKAKKRFEERKYKGKFFVKDLENNFDTSGLLKKYDLIIAMDFLEHVRNPSIVISKCREMMDDDSMFMVSIPNWRIGHDFVYRGLFDFDNFVFFMNYHLFDIFTYTGSKNWLTNHPMIKTKLDSEKLLRPDLMSSWTWYIHTTKTNEKKNKIGSFLKS